MKLKRSMQRILSVVMAILMLFSIGPRAVFAEDAKTYQKITTSKELETGEYVLLTDTNYAVGELDGTWVTAIETTPENDVVHSTSYVTLEVNGQSVRIKDKNDVYLAPKGGNENGITEGAYDWTWEETEGKFTFAGTGADTVYLASNKNSQNKFRGYKTTTVNGNPNGYPHQFTLYKLSDGGSGEVTVAAPAADPQAGEVESGTQITLSSATLDATIYFTLDGSDPSDTTNANRQIYSDTNKPVIEADCTLKAVAVVGENSSAVQTLQYTVKADVQVPVLKDGEQVVIYAPAYSKALSSEKTSFYNVGTDITVTDGVVTGYGEKDVWTVIANEDGTYSFAQNGQNIGLAESHSSMDLGAVNDDWEVIDLGDGLYNIRNTGRGNYMEWYDQYSNWSTYNSSSAASDNQFQLSFYVVTDTPEPEGPLKDGEQVVIFAPAYNKALSTKVVSSFYNAGTDITVGADGSLSGYSEVDVWTVAVNEDGTYSFSYQGQNIGMEDTYTSMPLGGKNDKWVLEDAGDGCYYVKNTVRDSYMEWYADRNYWSAYNNIASGSEGMFALKFYSVTDIPGPEGPIEDGDNVVIYAPSYNKALSSEKTSFYNVGTDITVTDGVVTGYGEKDVWTVIANEDGTYSFAQNGQNIGLAESHSSMDLGAVNDDWEVIDLGDGLYNIRNTGRGNYMEWYDQYSNWSTYNSSSAASDAQFQLSFYVVTDMPEPDKPEVEGLSVEASPKSGASVEAGQEITLTAATGAEIYYTMATDGTEPADPEVKDEQKYSTPIVIENTPEKDKPVIIKAFAYIPATDTAEAEQGEVVTFTYKAPMSLGDYTLYFGQLHAHTNLSDGTGTVEQAFDHASSVENLDFLALTDHSNSFEGQSGLPSAGTTHLGDEDAEKKNASWHEGRQGARDITEREDDFVGLYGFEMTWSGGAPGHINTFNSEGFENRNAEPYRKGDNYDVLEAYFDTLNENPETISQFNHPGDTFGDFMDFALYDPVIDNQMTLIEVGNGEGAIGSSGYFPSYAYYTRALDKGWHVAPTNNQDNHKGNWGDSNTARSVVLATDLSEAAIYDAMKNYRVYATEDNDLSILYALNGNAMGSILPDQDSINITASIEDPTDTEGETKVEVIVNGGQTLAETTFTGTSADITFDDLPSTYGYYYLRVTQADKNIAVTAPVWVGESVNAGVSNTDSSVALPIKGDEIEISSQIYNNLSTDMTVTSLTYTMEGETEPFHTADVTGLGNSGVIGARTSAAYAFDYVAGTAGGFNINVQMKALINGEEFTFTDVLKLTVSDPAIATKVLIDGTHYNDYVNGYYSGNMTNFINMGTADNIQVRIAQPGETITADALKDVSLFVISSPLKYTSDYTGDAVPSVFEKEFIQVVSDYVKRGGTVIVCGLADYQDANSGLPHTTYKQANALLEGIGSTMRVNDDELIDQDKNGGQPYRLYFDDFNTGSTDPVVQKVLAGVVDSGLAYSSYSGCSISVGSGTAIVYGHDTTYSINSKNPAQGHDKPVMSYSDPYDPDKAVVQKGDVVAMATEQVGEGRVFVSGTVFCSNFEVAAEDQVSYSNGIMAQNILNMVKKEPVISTITEARAGANGDVFTVVGTVANGTAESGNAFFNTIYIQDDAGNGINVFPIDDSNIRRGDQVQITGSISEYIGDKQLSAINVTVLEGSKDVVISDVTTAEANDYATNFGRLVRVEGTVTKVTVAEGLVESILVKDESGVEARVFIDGYIGYSDESSKPLEDFVKEGAKISAIGFVSHDAGGNRLRVRDRSEIKAVTPDKYTVTITAENGTLVGSKEATEGETYTATLQAAEGYALPETVTVLVSGIALTSDQYSYDATTGKLTINAEAVTGNVEIRAAFKAAEVNPPVKDKYTVTISAENGTLVGAFEAVSGEAYTAKLQAAEGYALPETVTVLVNGIALTSDQYSYDATTGTLTINAEAVTGNVEIRAAFKALTPVVEKFSVKLSSTNGTVSLTEAVRGEDYKAVLKPAEGYSLPESIKVFVSGNELASESFTYNAKTGEILIKAFAVNGNIEIKAEFVKTSSTNQPGTGNYANAGLWAGVLLAGGMACVMILRRRRKEAE